MRMSGGAGRPVPMEQSPDLRDSRDATALQRFQVGLAQFSDRVDRVRTGDWDRPTPDAEWSVRDLVRHLVDEHRWVAPLLSGNDIDAAGQIVAALPAGDPAGDWRSTAEVSARAFGEPGALDRDVALSYGPTPARGYLAEMTGDLAVHSWDLGRALGEDVQLPDELARATLEMLAEAGDLSGSGYFAAPVGAAADASITDRLVALSGRRPDWTPG